MKNTFFAQVMSIAAIMAVIAVASMPACDSSNAIRAVQAADAAHANDTITETDVEDAIRRAKDNIVCTASFLKDMYVLQKQDEKDVTILPTAHTIERATRSAEYAEQCLNLAKASIEKANNFFIEYLQNDK